MMLARDRIEHESFDRPELDESAALEVQLEHRDVAPDLAPQQPSSREPDLDRLPHVVGRDATVPRAAALTGADPVAAATRLGGCDEEGGLRPVRQRGLDQLALARTHRLAG